MIEIRIPGRVWYDALDPMASGMEAAIGLPQPQAMKKGRGETFVYRDVSPKQAVEVADYLQDRATTLGSQWGLEPAERELYYTMHSVGHRIRRAAGRAPGGQMVAQQTRV
jgi:hypothetical protein